MAQIICLWSGCAVLLKNHRNYTRFPEKAQYVFPAGRSPYSFLAAVMLTPAARLSSAV